MDEVDRRLLYELDLGSRQPLSKIARKLRLSERIVSYRLNKLVEEKVIEKFITIMNTSRLGFTDYKLYIRLANVSSEKEGEILGFLIAHPYIQWVAFCQGNYDLILAVYARNIVHFHSILSGIQEEIGSHMAQKDLSIISGFYNFRRSYLIGGKRKAGEFTYYGEEPRRVELDEADIKILTAVSQNARIPTIEIARETGLSPEVAKYRLKKLLKENVIQGFRPRIDTNELGVQYYKILLSLNNRTEEVERKIVSCLETFPNVVYATKCVAPWDLEFECEVESTAKLQEILAGVRDSFPGNIKDYRTVLILKEMKFDYLPMGEKYDYLKAMANGKH